MQEGFTPKQLGFRFPAEWHRHIATWLSYPHNENSWPGKIDSIYPYYNAFIKELSEVEQVHINTLCPQQEQWIKDSLQLIGCKMDNIYFHPFKTNDAWIRDHGPAFVLNDKEKALVDWNYNAWGGKYPAELDNLIPEQIAEYRQLTSFHPNIIMEGGSIDVNGVGDLITTEACLLNENRNPHLDKQMIEEYLCEYYGVENVLWLKDGIEGDDTDGHVDDLTRFVNEDTIVTVVEKDRNDENYEPLQENLRLLNTMRLHNGKQLNVAQLPMPKKVIYEDQRLPASYANFYIANDKVIMPIYKCDEDEQAFCLLESIFKDRKIIAIDSTDIVWGLGSFHCLSQQEPELIIK